MFTLENKDVEHDLGLCCYHVGKAAVAINGHCNELHCGCSHMTELTFHIAAIE